MTGVSMRAIHAFLVALALLSAGCASLPPPQDRVASTALADTGDTRLGRAVGPLAAAHPGRSGIHPLPQPRDAFAARALLAAAADRSIDVQYYIWHDDDVGDLLFEALWNAADRGVRVRILLDDMNTKGLDGIIATLDAHPSIEVRLYNPLMQRQVRLLNFVGDFERVNRRMHNKSFTVDNQLAIVGGRNIGNEYFAAGAGMVFMDLDVIAAGAVVPGVSAEFDRYWNSASAYPAAQVVSAPADAAALQATFDAARARPSAVAYVEALRTTPVVQDLLEGRLRFEWSDAQVLSDDPAKTLDKEARTDVLLFPELVRTIGRPTRSLDLVTPYFVPGEGGTAALADLARSGVRVRILTNSLAASDVSAVHAGYAKRRVQLLQAGVQLFELKPTAARDSGEDFAGGSGSSSGLHAKTFAVDGAKVFVGSFNFDQRSARLNTEMGLVIDSASLATQFTERFDEQVPRLAWRVRLAPDGATLQWVEQTAAGERVYATEPDTGWWARFKVQLLEPLPIDWLL
jgi:putative cardiolipin synthase